MRYQRFRIYVLINKLHLAQISQPQRVNSNHQHALFVSFWRKSPPVDHGPLIHEVFRSDTTTHYSRWDSSGRVISSSQRPLPDNTQHAQQTDIHAPGWIRTHNLSRGAAADPRLRARGHWDRLQHAVPCTK